MPSGPATSGEQAMVSLATSLRNCARGLSAPFLWFFHAMRVRTSFISASSTPYLLAYAGASRLNDAGAVSVGSVPSFGGRVPDEAGEARVLQLLDADRHGDVERARRPRRSTRCGTPREPVAHMFSRRVTGL